MASAAVAVPVRVVSSRNASKRVAGVRKPGGLDLVRGSFVGISFLFVGISFHFVCDDATTRTED